jgi:virginiamycin B lyase
MGAINATRVAALLAALAFALLAVVAAGAAAQPAISEWGIPTSGSQPSHIVPDGAGNLWFTQTAGNKIGRVSQNGVFQEFNVPTGDSQPWGIAVGPDGRVWFTQVAGNRLAHVTPSTGVIGQDAIPTTNSEPRGIVVDAAGNVWFAQARGNKIARMTEHGVFSEWTLPTANSRPWDLALDGSGNIWFTQRDGNKIGRISSTGGNRAEFDIPTANSEPTGIAVDASGNIWFAQYEGNKIARMTPAGQFTEYDIPTAGSRPMSVAIDAAGGVWYTGYGTNSFGRLYNGVITEYGLPTANSRPYGIAVDAGGNVWITEQAANRIAKVPGLVVTPTATPAVTPTPVGPTPTPRPAPPAAPRDQRYFNETGFRIDNNVFWDYFQKRGGVGTFGYPVSRTFTLLGFTTQFFQRGIMQIGPDGSARTMNILDAGLMPYTRINGSTFPSPDPAVQAAAPAPGSADYDVKIQQFIANYAPNQWEGMNVNFYQAFVNTVKLRDAFPDGDGNPALLPLLNLEMWGVPTSRPQRDPNNHNFVYQRFQRGIMHFDRTNGYTQALLLADYLKGIMTGRDLPADLREQAQGSPFYMQYNTSKANWVDRPEQLPGTDLFYAFERQ